MVYITQDNFSIRQICGSGQCFRLREKEGATKEGYTLTALGRYLEIWQEGKGVSLECTQEEFDSVWKGYFDLETDYGKILDSIEGEDTYLCKAALYGSGIRILRQDLWEMVVSFIISQQNNLKRIRRCIDLLCNRYGEEKRTPSGTVYYDFPTPEALAGASLQGLNECNLGYRSRYIHETASSVWRGEVDLGAVGRMGYGEAKAELLKLCGVGVKVAECICLFALHKTEAFPVDTHINKVLREQYPDGFPAYRYKGYEGIVQQYIFYYEVQRPALDCVHPPEGS